MTVPPPLSRAGLFRFIRFSLAARLTIWFAVMAFVLLFGAAVLMYWKVATHLTSEDEMVASMKLALIEALLSDALPPPDAVQRLANSGEPSMTRTTYVRVLLPDGGILAQTDGMNDELPAALIPNSRKPRIMAGLSGEQYWVTSSHVNGKTIQVATEADDEGRLLAPYRGRMWILFALAFVVAGTVGYRIALHGIQPVTALVETMRGTETSTLDKRIDVTVLPIELAALGDTFNAMLERLHRSFKRVSQVSDDMAHQLRTPLGIIRGQLEVALRLDRTNAEYRDIMESSLEEIVTLSDLVHRMLFLARAENQATAMTFDDIHIGRELMAVHDLYEPLASEGGISLDVAIPTPSPIISIDRLLVLRAIGNLVSNAIRHTPPGGTVTIETKSTETGFQIMVADTGCGILPDHLPHIFDRFYRTGSAGTSGRSGLGLAIVKAIAELHGGNVSIVSAIGMGTRVVMVFPSAICIGVETAEFNPAAG